MLLWLSMAMRAKQKCMRDDSDSERDDKSDSGGDGDHKNVGDHSAANTPSVPAKGSATLELADATDGVATAKPEVLGPWLEAGCHRPVEQ
jgi:hypothetical protein